MTATVEVLFRDARGNNDGETHELAGSRAEVVREVLSMYGGTKEKPFEIRFDGAIIWRNGELV